MNPVELLLSKLPTAKRNGQGWIARCPAHDDHTPSLSVAKGDDGRALVKCHAGCSADDVVVAIGLTMADLMPADTVDADRNRQMRPNRRNVSTPKAVKTFPTALDAVAELERLLGPRSASWVYTDLHLNPVGMVVRWDRPGAGKEIRPVARNGIGWIIGGMAEPRPLYRLPDLVSAERVYICEGEKAVDAARSVGLTATTSAHGSKSAHKADWGPLAGKELILLPDNDSAGRSYADTVVDILAKLTPITTIKVVELPDLPLAGDIADFVTTQKVAGETDATIRAEIEALVNSAEPVAIRQRTCKAEQFKPFPVNALPDPIQAFIHIAAKSIGCDSSYIALPMLSALASAIGNTRRIRLKPGWDEPAIVWTGIVGDSGTAKSPALDAALRPVRKRQHEAMSEHTNAMTLYRDEMKLHDRDLVHWKRGKGEDDPPTEPQAPVPDRCWCDDTTVEALAVLLLNQWRGLLMVRDELAGWIAGFDRYAQGKGGDVAKWLEMFGGRSMIVDRKTTEPIYVPRAAVSIVGGIQPETLRRRLKREHRENGLAARLLLAWPPRRPKRWTESGISTEAQAAVAAVFDRLYGLQPGIDDDGESEPKIVSLTPEGKREWIDFYNNHAEEQANLTGDLAAVWSKLEGYAARLALVIHCVRWVARDETVASADEVDEKSIMAGVKLSKWFGHEARRVYGMLDESEEDSDQRRLVELVRSKGGSVTPRELMRSSRQFKTSLEVKQALDNLVDTGLGQWQKDDHDGGRGRPAMNFVLANIIDADGNATGQREGPVNCVSVNTVNADDDDLQHVWEERAAIYEIDGGLSKEAAEEAANKEIQKLLASSQKVDTMTDNGTDHRANPRGN